MKLNRREFLTLTTAAAGATLLPMPATALVRRRYQFKYIHPEIPPAWIPPYHGTTYQVKVPDTLDLAERARLAIHALTSLPDPHCDYELPFVLIGNRYPAVLRFEWSDFVGGQPKFMEAISLLRSVAGSTEGMQAELGMMRAAVRMIGEDGLYYQPIGGRPWALYNTVYQPVSWAKDLRVLAAGQFSDAYSCGRMLLAMACWYQRDSNPVWRSAAEHMIARVSELARREGDYAFLAKPFVHPGYLTPGGELDRSAGKDHMPFTYAGLIHGFTRYYKITGYAPALDLAGRLSRFWGRHSGFYGLQGKPAKMSHFHGGTVSLLAMLEYAALAHDESLIDLVRSSFETYRTIGNPVVGFFPELVKQDYPSAESCEIANMIDLAVRLSQLQVGDYWDDADRWLRNQFAENQLTHCEWIERLSASSPHHPVGENETAHDAIRRNLGAFAGWASGNDFIQEPVGPLPRGLIFMHCCTGNASRAIFYAWQGILGWSEGCLRVNLLLNRASREADVMSYLPYQGRVDVKVKKACRVLVRIPSWTNNVHVRARIDGDECLKDWEGRYLNLGECQPGQTATIEFPLGERKIEETIGGKKYTLVLKGNEVVNVDPPGKYSPLYQREHYRKDEVRWKTVRRFISDESLIV